MRISLNEKKIMKIVVDCDVCILGKVMENLRSYFPCFGLFHVCDIPTQIGREMKVENWKYDICLRCCQSILFTDIDTMIKNGVITLGEATNIRQTYREKILFDICETYIFVGEKPNKKIIEFFKEKCEVIVCSDIIDCITWMLKNT